ncbi:tRNA preQ1(34) S-adenosylmethionine ribosyltransferase-isomerase QueA [Cerasicoccus arenae]|uniref:S-adenosylmethionine:tRNA ribosyltransferase-isomerase n=1 Tax=Cerasicoccus arenae TaxID=424488 RepID=A0A8J3D900_9BACT|nr:tRNA preQ1(34) S-adenosylmethionine ribosyltransferase-isomerase QueA [Cerasicoccus arenae]MBK1857672.1 tRNA preQ1(34) S-adenosylmethionine ribosyltransferase-isomerase QueA [Cerasicoccus arenae]GHB91467.1 S-adenosylmethionine:tRNA ribosyltransferase-isomerase [Cerasicoccus arenae]
MQTDDFDYPLPSELIAQAPADRRDHSRLMVVNRATREVQHAHFRDLPDFLPQSQVFRNNACVFRARLPAKRPTGGAVECLLLHPAQLSWEFWCLLRPGRRLPEGATFGVDGVFTAEVLEKRLDGENRVRFTPLAGQDSVTAIAESAGNLPLPPYIEQARRESDSARDWSALDLERYQTVYADPRQKVAAAAPTAGLHFTPELMAKLATAGTHFHNVTLHVGLDTFRPISVDRIEDHVIHREFYELPATTRAAADAPGLPRVAVGTTSLRALEDYARKRTAAQGPFSAEADIFVYPPADFAVVNHLITNFHLPRSTLLCLVSAFLTPNQLEGIKWLKELYQEAISLRYRFYSYGDAMLLL